MRNVILILFLLCHVRVWAQVQSLFFHNQLFTAEDGLGGSTIGDLKADKNGMVWIVVQNQFQLFDGKNFINMNDHIPSDRIQGRFSFGIGDELYFMNNRLLVHLDTDTYLPRNIRSLEFPSSPDSGWARILFEDIQYLYIHHPNDSLYQLDKSLFSVTNRWPFRHKMYFNYKISEIGGMTSVVNQFEFVDSLKNIYTFDIKSGEIRHSGYKLPPGRDFIKIGDDTLAVLGPEYLYICAQGKIDSIVLPAPPQKFIGYVMEASDQDNLIVALCDHLYSFNLRTMSWIARYEKIGKHELFETGTRHIDKDRLGNIYVAHYTNGLIKFYPNNPGFQYIGLQNENRFAKCISVSEKNNMVLLGSGQDGVYLFDTLGNFLQHITGPPDVKSPYYIWTILKVSDDQFILAGRDVYDLQIRHGRASLKVLRNEGWPWTSYYANAITAPGENVFAINTCIGNIHISPGNPPGVSYEREALIPNSIATCRYKENWITVFTRGLKIYDRSYREVIRYMKLPDFGYVRSIEYYKDDQVLLATDLGLYLLAIEDSVKIVRRLYDRLVYSILPGDEKNVFWFGTNEGIFRLGEDFQLTHFTRESGVQENEFNTNSCYKSPTGKLYFGGVNGITTFYPSMVGEHEDKIVSYVSQLTSSSGILARYITADRTPTFVVGYNDNKIEMELLGQGKKSPKSYHYQCLVKGLNSKWIDLANSGKINFHLAPGKYTFYYEVNNGFNPEAKPSSYFTIIIQAPLYRRWWFISSSAALGVGLLFYLFIQRKKKQTLRLMYEIQLNEKLQEERMRISRELHDNIGAQMATVKRNINFLVSHLEDLPKAQVESKMRDLESISTQINQELRDTIWAAQNVHISVGDFIKRIKSYIFQVLGQDSPIRVHYEEHCDKEVVLGPFTALNLHRICQEAINNIMKHAQASEVIIAFEGDQQRFKVSIADNGKGFNAGQTYEGYGLQNIRYRAGQIQANILFGERPGGGSRIEIEIDRLIMADKTEN